MAGAKYTIGIVFVIVFLFWQFCVKGKETKICADNVFFVLRYSSTFIHCSKHSSMGDATVQSLALATELSGSTYWIEK